MAEVEFLGLDDFMTVPDIETEEVEDQEDKEEIEDSTKEVEETEDTSEDDNPGGVASEDQETEEEDLNEETTSSPNVYTSLANALKQESVFPDLDLSNKELKSWDDFKDIFKEYVEKEVESKLDETNKFLKKAIENGADTKELVQYKNTLNY